MTRLLSAMLVACATASSPASAQNLPPPPAWDMIAFEAKSWGQPISSWRLRANGGGSWTETVRQPNAAFGDFTLVTHEIAPEESNYIAIERIFAALPIPAPSYDDCANFMTDMPYGTLRLTKGATTTEVAWNSGCMDEGYAALLYPLKQADSLVGEWGKSGSVLRQEVRGVEG